MWSKLAHLFTPRHTNNHKPKVLHHTSLAILVSLLITSQALIALVGYFYPRVLGYASQIPPETIIELTNQKRNDAGLAPLTFNAKLADAARRKAADMFAKDYWAHNSPDGTTPWAFITAAGYSYLHAGENLARDFTNANAVVDAWMASPTHKDNLLNSRYQEVGIAVVDGQLGSTETTLVVQMFGTPQSSQPSLAQASTTVVPQVLAQEPTTAPTKAITQTPTVSPSPIYTPTPTPTPTPTTQAVPTQDVALNQPLFSIFTLSKAISLSFVLLIFIVLLIDWFVAWDKNLIRLSGRNWAHLTFLAIVIALALIIKQGLIL